MVCGMACIITSKSSSAVQEMWVWAQDTGCLLSHRTGGCTIKINVLAIIKQLPVLDILLLVSPSLRLHPPVPLPTGVPTHMLWGGSDYYSDPNPVVPSCSCSQHSKWKWTGTILN